MLLQKKNFLHCKLFVFLKQRLQKIFECVFNPLENLDKNMYQTIVYTLKHKRYVRTLAIT